MKEQNGKGCLNRRCKHNMFYSKLDIGKGFSPTEDSIRFNNCMLRIGSSPFTLDEIGRMWGLSRERIRQVERDALIKVMRDAIKIPLFVEMGFSNKPLLERMGVLREKKSRQST